MAIIAAANEPAIIAQPIFRPSPFRSGAVKLLSLFSIVLPREWVRRSSRSAPKTMRDDEASQATGADQTRFHPARKTPAPDSSDILSFHTASCGKRPTRVSALAESKDRNTR